MTFKKFEGVNHKHDFCFAYQLFDEFEMVTSVELVNEEVSVE